ncbi:hypothetical protein LF1_28260 [Rubripirellula obstinata]|uniref:Potassium channel protein n=1 Tax=Rubripirellula obstinata TaxID=406547 RepID=A0A5B1CGG9_9BACT|nr:potassium channel protein [Rubripirellula obstinata]KAA1260287.1 hypothetical protein LF1_28260 [Rubripirellula obstinata]
MNRLHRNDVRYWIAARAAPVMFTVALVFLICQAVLVVIWVDVPNLSENALVAIDPASPEADQVRRLIKKDVIDQRIARVTSMVMLVVWVIVIFEAVCHWTTRPWNASMRRFHGFSLLFCVCPSLRMCARSPEMNHRLWLPGLGWRQPNRRLRKRLQKRFSLPMIVIALLIMPVLIIEFFMKAQVAQYTWLRLVLHIGTGVIWFAFAFEFILMVSVADKKLAYCKKHWIDLAIIALPIFSFLRSFQWLRATRASRLLKLKHVTQLARVYRLRGTAVKAFRALIFLDLFQRLAYKNPERAIEKLSRRLAEVETEAKVIRRKITRLQRRRDEQNSDQNDFD